MNRARIIEEIKSGKSFDDISWSNFEKIVGGNIDDMGKDAGGPFVVDVEKEVKITPKTEWSDDIKLRDIMEQENISNKKLKTNEINGNKANESNDRKHDELGNVKENESLLPDSEHNKEKKNIADQKDIVSQKKLIVIKIAERKFYEAHHILKTMINRYMKKKDLTKSMKIIFFYCPQFAKQNEFAFVCDLMITCLNILTEHRVKFTEPCAQKIIEIFNLCSCKSLDDKYKFMNKAIIWSKNETQPVGYIPFHKAVGYAYLNDENYQLAHNHFIYTDDSNVLYEALNAWKNEGYPSEAPYFVLRSVLSLIVLKKFRIAFEIINKFETNLDRKDVPLPIQLAYLITAACVHNSAPLYEDVKYRYRLILSFDPEFQNFIKEIDAQIFNKQKNDIFSLLQNILK